MTRFRARLPLLLIAAPAAVAIWGGWVGLGGMCGFGVIHPLPGIWDALRLNTAITLPIGVEAYGAYALGVYLHPSTPARARVFARRSAIGALTYGVLGQVVFHLLAAAHATAAPVPVVMLVSCAPVAVVGFGAALTHLLHEQTGPGTVTVESSAPGRALKPSSPPLGGEAAAAPGLPVSSRPGTVMGPPGRDAGPRPGAEGETSPPTLVPGRDVSPGRLPHPVAVPVKPVPAPAPVAAGPPAVSSAGGGQGQPTSPKGQENRAALLAFFAAHPDWRDTWKKQDIAAELGFTPMTLRRHLAAMNGASHG